MKVKLVIDPTPKRLTLILILVFLEAFIGPLNAVLQTGVWPSPVYAAGCLTGAILQVVTITLALLQKTEEQPQNPEAAAEFKPAQDPN